MAKTQAEDFNVYTGVQGKAHIEVMTMYEFRRGLLFLGVLCFLLGLITGVCVLLIPYSMDALCKFL